MKLLRAIKRTAKNSDAHTKILEEIREEIVRLKEETNSHLQNNLALNQQIASMQRAHLELLSHFASKEGKPFDFTQFQRPIEADKEASSSKDAIARMPLLIAEKTYNTGHPDYNANLVRNFPTRILNAERGSNNNVYKALLARAQKKKGITEIPDNTWQPILDAMLKEVSEIPHAEQVFERKSYIENYIAELSHRYKAHYHAGWVNLEDALFLYWLIRTLKPKTIVQTGVCNGLSSAFMMLALVKNGPEGQLYVIDLPAIFDPKDPAWTIKDKVYGVLIPEGQSSGWMVPDAYRSRFHVQCGDAKLLLPPLVDKLDNIDLFYHDSDHTYHHMMFEFREAKRKLSPGGLIVGDDISWNESVWDFADQYQVPSYNYKGAVGVAFF